MNIECLNISMSQTVEYFTNALKELYVSTAIKTLLNLIQRSTN